MKYKYKRDMYHYCDSLTQLINKWWIHYKYAKHNQLNDIAYYYENKLNDFVDIESSSNNC